MTDYVPVDDIDVSTSDWQCEVCDKPFTSEQGVKIHESRQHGHKRNKVNAGNASKSEGTFTTPKPPKTKPGRGKQPFISSTTKLTSTGKDITLDLMAAAIAWGAIRYVMSSGVTLTKKEQEDFIIEDGNREIMFRPLTDLFEQFTPGVRIMNTIAERFDYIQCLMLWKSYRDEVLAYAETKQQQQGVNGNGPTGQSDATNNGAPTQQNGGGAAIDLNQQFGDFIPNGFGNSSQVA